MVKAAWLIPVLPLLGFFFHLLVGERAGKKAVSAVAVGTVLASFLLSVGLYAAMNAAPGHRIDLVYFQWMAVDTLKVPFGFTIDPLAGMMLLFVTGIATLIHLYSVGYMWEDEGFARFFSYLNLFVFFMTVLVMGSSLPLLFVGWEGVGLCSYLLIGYFYRTDFAPDAGLKAFLTNRVGDLGVVIGMLTLYAAFDTLTVGDMLTQAGQLSPEVGFGVLTFATLMLFVGATGKSAQIPLYLWLPDAMAGPTPVSALIHAATMVTSGIYLLCRLAPVFQLAPITLDVVAWVGAGTALFAATIGLVQRDIKKVLAYSTVSQLGYMFLGLGATGFAAGFFHVFTHAFFKALLFLGAGSVIHAMHHEQDLFKMGQLKEKMPLTFWTMAIATLAIIGFPGTSGFASKDEILYLAFLKSPLLWGIGVLGAMCTSFYMVRLFTLTFFGHARDHHAFDHAHESPWTMTTPLVVLGIGAVLAVGLGWPHAFGGHFQIAEILAPALTYGQVHPSHVPHGSVSLAWILAGISTTLGLGSAALGYVTYRNGLAVAEARAARFPALHRILLNKYYVDEGVELVLLKPLRSAGQILWKAFDVVLIDGLGVRLWAGVVTVLGDLASLFQTGRVRNYALAMALGLVGLLWAFLS